MRKLASFLGLIGALLAAEGLNRLSTFVSVFRGSDAPFYSGMLVVSVISAGVLLVSLFQPITRWVKWLTGLALLGSASLMSVAPNLPVTQQIMVGMVFAFVGVLSMLTAKKVAPPIVDQKASP